MNLIIRGALVIVFLAMLTAQPTLIYGAHRKRNANGNDNGSKHWAALAAGSHLVLETKTGEVLVREARGAADAVAGGGSESGTDAATPASATASTGKRSKNNQNNKKQHKNLMSEHGGGSGGAGGGGGGAGGRNKHGEKRNNAAAQQRNHEHQGNHNNNNNRAHKQQRQMLKSQQHQTKSEQQHQGKRSGNAGAKSKQAENGEKTTNEEKSPSTCRYAKSAWSDCDAKSNMRTRTLTLKKGEPNCLPTRTMQKKCRKVCRYEKGAWSECSATGQMTREDKLKVKTAATVGGTLSSKSADTSCDPVRVTKKECPVGGSVGAAGKKQPGGGRSNKERKHKEKGTRQKTHNTQHA